MVVVGWRNAHFYCQINSSFYQRYWFRLKASFNLDSNKVKNLPMLLIINLIWLSILLVLLLSYPLKQGLWEECKLNSRYHARLDLGLRIDYLNMIERVTWFGWVRDDEPIMWSSSLIGFPRCWNSSHLMFSSSSSFSSQNRISPFALAVISNAPLSFHVTSCTHFDKSPAAL